MRGDDRGVSEVLGFVLVFGIVIGSVGLLSVVGFQTMTEYQEGEQLRNAERGMDALADNFNDVLQSDGIDERSGELALREGTVTTGGDGATLKIEVDGDPIEIDEDEEISLGSFEYSVSGRADTIAYEGGGVFRGDSSGDVPISEPPIRCDSERGVAVVSLVVIDAEERSLASSNVQEFTAVKQETHTEFGDNVTIEFTEDSTYQDSWDDVLSTWDDNGDKYRCEEDIDRALVRLVVIDIEY